MVMFVYQKLNLEDTSIMDHYNGGNELVSDLQNGHNCGVVRSVPGWSLSAVYQTDTVKKAGSAI